MKLMEGIAKCSFGTITAILAAADLWCKSYVEKNLQKGKERLVFKKKISIRKVYNKGMAFNVGEKFPKIVKYLSGIVCGLSGVFSVQEWLKGCCIFRKLAASFVLAGAISNTYDRFTRNQVVDYFGFNTKNKKIRNITFNLGDMFIFTGSIVLFVTEIFGTTKN